MAEHKLKVQANFGNLKPPARTGTFPEEQVLLAGVLYTYLSQEQLEYGAS